MARHWDKTDADPELVEELLRDLHRFDPFAITKWKVIAGPDPGYLPTMRMRRGVSGWWIDCKRCGAEFESKGLGLCELCRKLPVGKQPLVGTVATRSKCRHCHANLPNPVEADHSAFCSRDCYARFYRRHCLVCEKETDLRSPDDRSLNLCGRRCRTTYQKNPAKHRFLGGQTAGGYRGEQVRRDDQKSPSAAAGFLKSVCDLPVDLAGGSKWSGRKLPGELTETILTTEVGRSRKRSVGADIIPDEHWPNMWRVRSDDGTLSDMLSLARARDLALTVANTVTRQGGRHQDEQTRRDDERNPYAAAYFLPSEGPVGLPPDVLLPQQSLPGLTGPGP